MPTNCPVSEIIKQRKVQGKECYEVSWEEKHGLKTSIVPADLLERLRSFIIITCIIQISSFVCKIKQHKSLILFFYSACPEKIVEFQEGKAQRKKQNRCKARPKKPGDESSMAEIDQRLQNLLLDIESGSNTITCPSLLSSKTEISENRTNIIGKVNPTIPVLEKDWESCIETGPSGAVKYENEIIDLLSPSPARLQCKLLPKQQKNASDEAVDLIELSESETEMSPEHHRKARELRLFLASIKD